MIERAVEDVNYKYDGEKDGVWLLEGDQEVVFLPRHAIISLLSELSKGND